MSRAERLLDLIQVLRRHRQPVSGRALAQELGVSIRTLYRDIASLQAQGASIDGEPGVGYVLRPGFMLPPLMFSEEEIEALVLGARIVKSWADAELARAADDVLAKVESVLPQRLKERIPDATLFAPAFHIRRAASEALQPLRGAIRDRAKVRFAYEDRKQERSARTVQPLGLFYWGATWSLGAWCELRRDFRNFRVDRMSELKILDEKFKPEPGRTLVDFFRAHDPDDSR